MELEFLVFWPRVENHSTSRFSAETRVPSDVRAVFESSRLQSIGASSESPKINDR